MLILQLPALGTHVYCTSAEDPIPTTVSGSHSWLPSATAYSFLLLKCHADKWLHLSFLLVGSLSLAEKWQGWRKMQTNPNVCLCHMAWMLPPGSPTDMQVQLVKRLPDNISDCHGAMGEAHYAHLTSSVMPCCEPF